MALINLVRDSWNSQILLLNSVELCRTISMHIKLKHARVTRFRDGSRQVTSATEPEMTHSNLCDSVSKGSLCQNSYSQDWLTSIEVVYDPLGLPYSQAFPRGFHFGRPSACGNCQPVSVSEGERCVLAKPWGARSRPGRRRSGSL